MALPTLTADQIKAQYPKYAPWNDSASIVADYQAGNAGASGTATKPTSTFDAGGNDLSTVLGSTAANRATFNQGQQAQTNDFLNRYSTAIQGQTSIPDLYSQIASTYGLPTLTQNANLLNEQVANLPYTGQNVLRGTGANQTQLDQYINQKIKEISPLAQRATDAKQQAEQLVSTQLGLEQQQQQKELLPFSAEENLLSSRLASEATGYNEDSKNTLDALIAKMQTGERLTEAEMSQATTLASQENQYKIAYMNDQTARKQNIAIPYGGALFNGTTGSIIASNPKTGTGGGGTLDDLNFGAPGSTNPLDQFTWQSGT